MNMKKWTLTLFVTCVDSDVAETSQRMVGHTPTEQLSGTLFQKTKAAKLACVITFLDFVFSFLCIFNRTTCSLHIHLQGQTDPYRVMCLILVQQASIV